MVCYIYCKINDRELLVDEDNAENIKIWVFLNRGKPISKPYWKQAKLTKDKHNYKFMIINKKSYGIHRINYYAHNQDWDIDYEPRNNMIDHKDNDKRNNHISNLRVGTNSLNQQNRSEKYVKGYSWDKNNKTYNSRIRINNKLIHIGCYKTEEEAKQAYLDAKKSHHKW